MHPDRKTILKKYFAGECSEEEKKIIGQLLLNESNTSLANYLQTEWEATAEHSIADPALADQRYQKIAALIGKRRSSYRTWYWAAAVLLVIALPLAWLKFLHSKSELQWATLSAGPGEQKELVLADGSHVWLNSASSITYPKAFTGHERKISIKGEAFFQVTKNREKPFIVAFNNHYTRVLGTSFNIRSYAGDATERVTVIEGSVAVGEVNNSHYNQYTVLKANESVLLADQTGSYQKSVLPNAKNMITWQKGEICFNETLLPEVVAELQRRYNASLVLDKKPGVKMPSFTVRVNPQTSLNDVLEILSITNKITYKKVNESIVITPK